MPTLENVTVIDDIRKDALLLMQSRGIDYAEAYAIAQNNLIGDTKVTEFEAQPMNIDIDDNIVNFSDIDVSEPIIEEKTIDEGASIDLSIPYYKEVASTELSGIIKISDYTNDQLKALVVAHQMGVDVSKIAFNIYSPEQINFLALLLITGNDISKYKDNNNFDINEETIEIFGADAIESAAKEEVDKKRGNE